MTGNVMVYSFDCLYAGQDKDLRSIPAGWVNKTVCGCGLTSLAIENEDEDCVIAVPNVALVRNKVSQYRNHQEKVQGNALCGARRRFDGEVMGVWGEVSEEEVRMYVERVRKVGTPVKILVTYDSLWKVEHLIMKDCDRGRRWRYSNCCRLIVDESNKLVSYMSLKVEHKNGERNIDVINHLYEVARQAMQTVTFISATPVAMAYVPEFISRLPQVEMRWKQGRKVVPICMKRSNPCAALEDEIIRPMKRDGEVRVADRVVRKVIVFVNSVNTIHRVLSECRLERDEVAVVCGDTSINSYKTRGFNILQDPSSLPTYTFVTSTGFQGIDLNDSEAMTVVVSSTEKKHYMIDLSTDLMQAISRQRDRNNPNQDRFIYIYNQDPFSEKTESQLISEIDSVHDRVKDNCENLLRLNRGSRSYRSEAETLSQSPDFVRYTFQASPGADYQLNEALFQSEKYYILETRRRYTQGFDLTADYAREHGVTPFIIPPPTATSSLTYKAILAMHQSMTAEAQRNGGETDYSVFTPDQLSSEYFTIIDKCHSHYHRYFPNSTYARKMALAIGDTDLQFQLHISQLFHKGNYTMKQVKATLNQAYSQYGISRKAKDYDLQEFGYKIRITMPQRRKHIRILETPG